MRLIVGPENLRGSLVGPTTRRWNQFVAEIGALPCACGPVTFFDVRDGASGVACAFVFTGPRYPGNREYARIILSAGFFARTPAEQTLTLLHECIHLRFMMGPLRDRAVAAIELREIHAIPNDVADEEWTFLHHRVSLAFELRHFVDEILAECYLRAQYPAYLDARIAYYLSMRRGSINAWQQTVPTLQPTAIFLEVLKNELGVRLADGHPEAAEFAANSEALQRQFRAQCSEDEYRRWQTMKDRLMGVQLEPVVTFDAAACDEIFDATMRLTRPMAPAP